MLDDSSHPFALPSPCPVSLTFPLLLTRIYVFFLLVIFCLHPESIIFCRRTNILSFLNDTENLVLQIKCYFPTSIQKIQTQMVFVRLVFSPFYFVCFVFFLLRRNSMPRFVWRFATANPLTPDYRSTERVSITSHNGIIATKLLPLAQLSSEGWFSKKGTNWPA